MSSATVKRVGDLKGPERAWLVSLLGTDVTDDAEVQITLRTRVAESNGETWTPELNHRRCDLVDKKFSGALTPEETRELESLTATMRRYVHRVAPVPLAEARRLHQQLLEDMAATDRGA